ncbi:hypothetical protein Prudu_006525 [Prunus dulcis]|uniref:CCHC-type domain-containing protein n=1 Tax=Prunus dulcis TaxID=3755 RepID=A0A4Y1QZZ2_PRUDU|nr:hypothetical protein Prudu_006525 [Prunus dulcis]
MVGNSSLNWELGAPRPWWRFSSGELEAIVTSIAFNIRSVEDHPVTEVELRRSRMDRASGSIAHPPYFDGNNYGAWKAKMKSFLWSLDERVWSTVVHGFPKPTKKIGKGDEETTILKAREEWTTAEVTHEGTDTVKGAKLQMHTLQFETLMMDENETFSEFYAKLCVIVNACSSLGEKIPEDRVVKKILRSLPQRFQPKITAIEEIRDLNTLKVQELIGSIQTYEMKHLALKKSKTVAFKVVNEEDDGHSNEDCSDEELTILTRRFMNFLKNQDPRSRDSKGYGHISSECANTLKKQKDSKNKAMHITWSDSESECENDEKTVALITTVSLDESHEDDDCKEVAVLKLENCRIANEFQSPDADSEKKKLTDQNKLIASLTSDNKALELELKNSKERIVSLTIGAEKIDKMISMGRRDGDKRGLGFQPSNKSSAVSKTKFVKSTSLIEPSAPHEVKKFIPICHFCGTRGHIRPRCNKLRNEFIRSNSHGMGGKGLISNINPTDVWKAPRPWWRFSSGELEAIVTSIAFNIRSVEDHPVTEVELRRSRETPQKLAYATNCCGHTVFFSKRRKNSSLCVHRVAACFAQMLRISNLHCLGGALEKEVILTEGLDGVVPVK